MFSLRPNYGVSDSTLSSSSLCHPRVRFTTASGQEIDFVPSYSTNTLHEGYEVPVQYHPDHPQDAFISSFMELWVWPLLAGGLGFILAFMGIVLIRLTKKTRSRVFVR